MTETMMSLQGLLEKSADADLLREMIGFAAARLMELEVGGRWNLSGAWGARPFGGLAFSAAKFAKSFFSGKARNSSACLPHAYPEKCALPRRLVSR
jgi:hypothetical protein